MVSRHIAVSRLIGFPLNERLWRYHELLLLIGGPHYKL